jgi:hypothetical protein
MYVTWGFVRSPDCIICNHGLPCIKLEFTGKETNKKTHPNVHTFANACIDLFSSDRPCKARFDPPDDASPPLNPPGSPSSSSDCGRDEWNWNDSVEVDEGMNSAEVDLFCAIKIE